MIELLKQKLAGRKVCILGFGREGKATYQLIRKALPDLVVTIADANESISQQELLQADPNVLFHLGTTYLNDLNQYDLILKTPGISFKDLPYSLSREKITSQTDLFLQRYSSQTIGITGTKGKSTTSSLLHFILKRADVPTILLGNIGRPAFECIDEIHPETNIVFELSSHQLEYITVAPHIAVLLNLYQEHLDAYPTFRDYQRAKLNILTNQKEEDYFIFNADDALIQGWIQEFDLIRNYRPFTFDSELADGSFVKEERVIFSEECATDEVLDLTKKRKLKGDHNLRNIMAALNVCKILGLPNEDIQDGVAAFTGLEHRLEYVGTYHGIRYYNDSIATIPEATIEAVKTLGEVDTLIVGGFDRSIEYTALAHFLSTSTVRNIIAVGEAGLRIAQELMPIKKEHQSLFMVSKFDDFLPIARTHTRPGAICLLSPAASSYDEFVNFEFRGKRFKELVTR